MNFDQEDPFCVKNYSKCKGDCVSYPLCNQPPECKDCILDWYPGCQKDNCLSKQYQKEIIINEIVQGN